MPTQPDSVAPADDFNAVPYPGHPFSSTHPGRLETLGRLHGLATTPANRCRVLEIGCGDGANLIPHAFLYPESRFVGVDLAGAPIARGRALIEAAGLTNVELHALDLRALPAELGTFDYLIAHGVYCWVPPVVADALLRTAGERLTPNGVAIISYNTYPGHHLRGMARQMMLYHTRAITDPERKVWQGVSLLKFLGESCVDEPQPYHLALREEFKRTAEAVKATGNGNVMFHDELAEFNEPVYFHQFASRAAAHGLRFLCESEFDRPSPKKLSAEAIGTLHRLAGQPIEREQYLDFLQARCFRQTLLHRAEAALQPGMDPAQLAGYHVAAEIWETDEEDRTPPSLAAGVPVTFHGRDDAVLEFDAPLVKAGFRHLAEIWPAALPLIELSAAAHARLDREGFSLPPDERPAAEHALLGACLVTFHGGVLELSPRPPARRAIRVDECPQVSPVARAQQAAGWPVANLCHEHVNLDHPLDDTLFPLLDGTCDHAALLAALVHASETSGESAESKGGKSITLRPDLERRLEELRRLAMLVEPGSE